MLTALGMLALGLAGCVLGTAAHSVAATALGACAGGVSLLLVLVVVLAS